MKTHQLFKKQLLAKPGIKKEYDLLKEEYAIKHKLIKLRLQKNITQAELAKRVGTKQSSVSRFENELVNPSLSFLLRISSALGKKLVVDFK